MSIQDRAETDVYFQPIRNSALEKVTCSTLRSGRFTPEKDPLSIVQEAEWASGMD